MKSLEKKFQFCSLAEFKLKKTLVLTYVILCEYENI